MLESEHAPQEPRESRIPAIDMFRGTAILLVILYHLNNLIIFPGGWGLGRTADGSARLPAGLDILRVVLLPFHMGRVGVNLFFVISGLCIHMRLARQLAENRSSVPFSISQFFLRRFLRIYPTYWAALGIGAFVAPFVLAAISPGPHPQGIPPLGDIAAHFVMLHSFFKPYIMSIIASLWSIATEEQFYLLYPIVFVLIGRRISLPWIVVGLLIVSLGWRTAIILSNPPPATFSDGPFLVWIFGFSLSRYYEWSLGALLAWAIANRRTLAIFPVRGVTFLGARPWLVMAIGAGFILIGAGSMLRAQTKYLLEDPCYSTGWFLILAAALLPSTASARPRSSAGFVVPLWRWAELRLQSLGRRSFSVYLLHEIALHIAAGLMRKYHLPPVTVGVPLACSLVWVICYPFFRFIEAPFEARSKAVGKSLPRLVEPVPLPDAPAGLRRSL